MKLEDAEHSWSLLADQLESFISRWQAGGNVPKLAEFLPREPAALRRMVLVELIKVDLEYRWQHRNLPKRIEEYANEFEELTDSQGLPCDLIYEEFHVRRLSGKDPHPDEFIERFPQQARELARLLPVESSTESTCLFIRNESKEVEVGQTLDDFHLMCKLGTGAFATVFLARQESMQRLVALKVSGDKGMEPQTLAQLDHPHIVRVYDQRRLPERGLRLLYMQYVSGGTLQDVVRFLKGTPPDERTGKQFLQAIDESLAKRGEAPPVYSDWRRALAAASWPEVNCQLGSQLAAALHYAQRRGVLHRDIKPANVLISADAAPKLADFNISYSSLVEGNTPAAYFGGSLAYMSPEQLEACNPTHARSPEELDGRSDLYSLAVMLWELLHGERPFQDERMGADWGETLEKMSERRHQGVSLLAVSSADRLTSELTRVLQVGLDPNPDQRWQDGSEMAAQLQLCMNPRAQQLLNPPVRNWRRMVRMFPLSVLIMAVAFPNLLASALNIWYNKQNIIEVQLPERATDFVISTIVINLAAYPLGMILVGWLAWPVTRMVRQLVLGKVVAHDVSAATRRLSLRLGLYIALFGIAAWILCALAFPVSFKLQGGQMDLTVFAYFLSTLTACGFMAAAYPFFYATLLAVEVFYPALMERNVSTFEDREQLFQLGRQAGFFLMIAGGVPMMSITVLILTGLQNSMVLGILSFVGLMGLGISFFVYRRIQGDVVALLSLAKSNQLGSLLIEDSQF